MYTRNPHIYVYYPANSGLLLSLPKMGSRMISAASYSPLPAFVLHLSLIYAHCLSQANLRLQMSLGLMDLPAEILDQIFLNATSARTPLRALRLRLVSRESYLHCISLNHDVPHCFDKESRVF